MELGRETIAELDLVIRSYIGELWQSNHHLEQTKRDLELRYKILEEEHRLLLLKRFGRSSEQVSAAQQVLFDAVDSNTGNGETDDPEKTITVREHTKKKPGRKPIDPRHPRVEIVHDLSEEEKHCACGHELVRIGEEITEKIQVIPEQMWIERHIRPKYACHYCEGSGDEGHPAVRIAPTPEVLLPRSIASASLIAFILINKYADHLPYYRQEQRFQRIGIDIFRQDMSNWTMAVAEKLQPLIERLRALIREGPFVQMDETPVQVLKEVQRENTSKSYMWLARGGPPEKPVTLYHYAQSRSAEYARELLYGFAGYLQADGYNVYRMLASEYREIVRVGCFAHVRRKFHEAAKASRNSRAAHEGLKYNSAIYRIEQEFRGKELDEEAFVGRRRELVEKELERFHRWLMKKQQTVVPSTLLGKAVRYALGEWEAPIRYLDHAYITPDNNAANPEFRISGRE